MDVSLIARFLGALVVIGGVLFSLQIVGRLHLKRALRPLGPRSRLVTIVETTYLPSAATLHVVKIGAAYAVIGRSAGSIAKVADVPESTVKAWLAGPGGG